MYIINMNFAVFPAMRYIMDYLVSLYDVYKDDYITFHFYSDYDVASDDFYVDLDEAASDRGIDFYLVEEVFEGF